MAGDKERVYDAYLAASARVGNRQSWDRLIERWQPKFLGHAYRLTGDPDLAAEAAQEAWLEVLRGIAQLDDAAAFPAWSLRIVSRRCAKLIRGRQRRRKTSCALRLDPDTSPETADKAQLRIDLASVQSAMSTLSSEQRAVIGLFYLEEMSIAEVSVVLGVPPGTVKTRLLHARRKLRARLEGGNDEKY